MRENAKRIAELLKVLANENRILILCVLIEQPATVNEIAKHTPKITQSALSQHLALMRAHGVLDYNRSGQNITYSIADPRVEKILNTLKENYC